MHREGGRVGGVCKLTISGAHKQLEGAKDGAVEGPAQERDRAGAGPLHGEAQPIVFVLHMPFRGKHEPCNSMYDNLLVMLVATMNMPCFLANMLHNQATHYVLQNNSVQCAIASSCLMTWLIRMDQGYHILSAGDNGHCT